MWYFLISPNGKGTFEGRFGCAPSYATQIPGDLPFPWSCKTAPNRCRGKWGTLVCSRSSLRYPGLASSVQAGKEDFHGHFQDTLNLHFKNRCCLNKTSSSTPFISPKALGMITKPDKVAVSVVVPKNQLEKETKTQRSKSNKPCAGTAVGLETTPRLGTGLGGFCVSLSIMHTLPFPLNDLVMFVPSHCVQTLQIKIASHLKKILYPLFFKETK